MAIKLFVVCFIAILQTLTAQCIGRAVNNGMYGNTINNLAVENVYGPYGQNLPYPANTLAYDGIVNGIYGPGNPLAYDGIGNGMFGPANPLGYDGLINGIYGPANPLAYDGIANGIYGPATPIAFDGYANGLYGPANPLAYDGIVNGVYGPTNTLACDNIGWYGLSVANLAASNGAGFSVRSKSPMSVNGISVESENMVIEGPLLVNGQLPFLGTVGVEGALPVAGNGAVLYNCGNGDVAILNEELPAPALPAGYGYNGMPTAGYGSAVAGPLGLNRAPYGGLY